MYGYADILRTHTQFKFISYYGLSHIAPGEVVSCHVILRPRSIFITLYIFLSTVLNYVLHHICYCAQRFVASALSSAIFVLSYLAGVRMLYVVVYWTAFSMSSI